MKRWTGCALLCAVIALWTVLGGLDLVRASKAVFDVTGTCWNTAGIARSKVQRLGSGRGEADTLVCFGPNLGFDLAANEFLVVIDDGVDQVGAAGLYVVDEKGRLALEVDIEDLEAELEALFGDAICDVLAQFGIACADVTINLEVDSVRARTCPRETRDGDVLRVGFCVKFTVVVTADGDEIRSKGSVCYKGSGGPAV